MHSKMPQIYPFCFRLFSVTDYFCWMQFPALLFVRLIHSGPHMWHHTRAVWKIQIYWEMQISQTWRPVTTCYQKSHQRSLSVLGSCWSHGRCRHFKLPFFLQSSDFRIGNAFFQLLPLKSEICFSNFKENVYSTPECEGPWFIHHSFK